MDAKCPSSGISEWALHDWCCVYGVFLRIGIPQKYKCYPNVTKMMINHRTIENFWDARKIVRQIHSNSGLCCHQAERRWYNLCIWKFAGPDWRIGIRRWLCRGFVNGVSPTWTIRMYYLNRYYMSECCFNWVRPVFRHTSIMNLSTSNSGWHINRCWNDGNLPRLSVKAIKNPCLRSSENAWNRSLIFLVQASEIGAFEESGRSSESPQLGDRTWELIYENPGF